MQLVITWVVVGWVVSFSTLPPIAVLHVDFKYTSVTVKVDITRRGYENLRKGFSYMKPDGWDANMPGSFTHTKSR